MMGFMAFLVIHLGLLFIKIKSGSSLAGKKEGLSSNSELSPGGRLDHLSCPSEVVVDEKYGSFKFPRTAASAVGTAAYANCPFESLHSGVIAMGFNQSNNGRKTRSDLDMVGTGVRYCFAIEQSHSNSILAIWNGFYFDNCRSFKMDIAIKSVKLIVASPMTEESMNQLMPQLCPLSLNAPTDYLSAQALVEAVNHALGAVEIFQNGEPAMTQIRQDLFHHLSDYTARVHLEEGQRVQVGSSDVLLEAAVFLEEGDVTQYYFESFQLPGEAIEKAREGNLLSPPRLEIKAYSDALFPHWGMNRDWNGSNNLNGTELEFLGKWRIYDVQFSGTEITNLSYPISYIIPMNKSENYQWVCAFWDSTENAWSRKGMKTVENEDSVLCESTHLTAFSVLIEPKPKEERVQSSTFKVHTYVLSIISSVGSALSIVGLTLTVLTFAIFRALRQERSNRMLLNLSLSLLLLHLFSISSGKELWHDFCTVPSALIHYFLLTSLSWMVVDAVFMYRILIQVFVQPETRFIMKRILLAWGTPLGFVILTASIDLDLYRKGRDDLCVIAGHLNLPLYYGTYLGPVILMLLTNAFVFGRIIIVLYQQNKKRRKAFDLGDFKGKKPSILAPIQTKGSLTLFVVFGLGWILGFGAVGLLELPFKYLYTVMNSGQGLLIFIFRMVLDAKVVQAVRRSVLPESESSFSSGTVGTVVGTMGQAPRVESRTSFSTTHAVRHDGPTPSQSFKKVESITQKLGTRLIPTTYPKTGLLEEFKGF